MLDSMKIFIPIKHNSQRVPNKNFRSLNNKQLWRITVEKVSKYYTTYIDTDSDVIIEQCSLIDNVVTFKRDQKLCGDKVSVVELLRNFKEKSRITDNLCQIHVTSPFLSIDHIKVAEEKIYEGYDSVFGVNVIQQRLWRKESYGYCPVNHNPMKLEQTQDLPKYYFENSYLYAFRPEILDSGNRIGSNPYLLEIGFPHNLDIDTEEDWDFIKAVDRSQKY
jgi:CMP-N-acetylneuraminic acid synthetase